VSAASRPRRFFCALAQNIEQIVAFRLLQGMCGAALVPLSQSVMLDAYPIEQRGQAMGIWGVGIMLGPIMGPTIGGYLTENYSWHWVFSGQSAGRRPHGDRPLDVHGRDQAQ